MLCTNNRAIPVSGLTLRVRTPAHTHTYIEYTNTCKHTQFVYMCLLEPSFLQIHCAPIHTLERRQRNVQHADSIY